VTEGVADHTLAYLRRLDEKLDAMRAELRADLAQIRDGITVLTGAFMHHDAERGAREVSAAGLLAKLRLGEERMRQFEQRSEARLARLEERAAPTGADPSP
jgi:hypothetical protein